MPKVHVPHYIHAPPHHAHIHLIMDRVRVTCPADTHANTVVEPVLCVLFSLPQ